MSNLQSTSASFVVQTGAETVDSTMFVYECPGNVKSEIRSIDVCEPSGLAYTVRVVKLSPKAKTGNPFELFDLSLDAGDKVIDDTVRFLSSGETIRFESNVSGTQLLLSFIETPV